MTLRTHPTGTFLFAEDAQAMRVRIGDVLPASSKCNVTNEANTTPSARYLPKSDQPHDAKRKASTTSEEYQKATKNDEDQTTESPYDKEDMS